MDTNDSAGNFASLPIPSGVKAIAFHWNLLIPKLQQSSMTKSGKFVKVRVVEPDGAPQKTYLGIMLGELPTSLRGNVVNEEFRVVPSLYNPVMYVFARQELVFGMQSWWGYIETPEDLKDITDQDITDIWYVQAGKSVGFEPNLGATVQ